jgi:hypothetical protein
MPFRQDQGRPQLGVGIQQFVHIKDVAQGRGKSHAGTTIHTECIQTVVECYFTPRLRCSNAWKLAGIYTSKHL